MRESDLVRGYIEVLVELLGTPWGALALVAVLVIALASFMLRNGRWFCLLAAMYAATLPLVASATIVYVPLAFPLQQLRAYARPITYLFVMLMLLPLMASERGWRRRLIPLPLLLYFIFEMCIALRVTVFGNEVRGVLSIFSYGLLLLTCGFAIGRWLQTVEDLYKLIWVACLAGGLVALGTCYQVAVNRSVIMSGNRLTGVTGNPQFLGVIMAFSLPLACHLLMRSKGQKWIRPALVCQVTIMIVLLLWTGSRTGAIGATVGIVVLFHRRLGQFFLFGVLFLITVLLVLPFFEGSSQTASRLLWTVNTRAGVWAVMIDQFTNNYLFGVAREDFSTSESSFLAMLSQFGIIGSLPCFAAMILVARDVFQLRKARLRFGPNRDLVDLITALWAVAAVMAIFEAFVIGLVTYPVLMLYVMASITAFLKDWSELEPTASDEPALGYAAAA